MIDLNFIRFAIAEKQDQIAFADDETTVKLEREILWLLRVLAVHCRTGSLEIEIKGLVKVLESEV